MKKWHRKWKNRKNKTRSKHISMCKGSNNIRRVALTTWFNSWRIRKDNPLATREAKERKEIEDNQSKPQRSIKEKETTWIELKDYKSNKENQNHLTTAPCQIINTKYKNTKKMIMLTRIQSVIEEEDKQ